MKSIIVDTNIILDILTNHPKWAEWSIHQIENLEKDNNLIINPIIYAELSVGFDSQKKLDHCLSEFAFGFEEIHKKALFLAAKAFKKYRQKGGRKTSPLPDFFIGAHAQASNHGILTRDKNRYATYFSKVPLTFPKKV